MRNTLIGAVGLAAVAVSPGAGAAELPGPSAQLFDQPYYTCLTNYYVSPRGDDSNDGAPSTPWRTLQRANDALLTGGSAAGSCINVAPGVYGNGVSITAGGNLASPTGYVVYRCEKLDRCIVTDVGAGGQNGSFVWNTAQPMTGNYVIVDGFWLTAAAETQFGQGIGVWNGTNAWLPSVHHIWILNSIISSYGQSGIQMNNGEYFFIVHNTIFDNSRTSCSAQGSGISFFKLIPLPNYVRTTDDNDNLIVGDIGNLFHNVVAWNVLHNNAVTRCGTAGSPYDTDGNNIIIDTLNWNGMPGSAPYTAGVLVAFNVTYNAGGGGVHLLNSEYVTAANNSCYNNYLDPYNQATWRSCIDSNGGYGNTIINNIAVALPGTIPRQGCGSLPPYSMWNNAILGAPPSATSPPDVFRHNITYVASPSCQGEVAMFNGDSYPAFANRKSTDPMWVDVGSTSAGAETAPPIGANFALRPGSPAVGYGLRKTYLPASSIDAGACSSLLTICP